MSESIEALALTARNATLADLVELLNRQDDVKYDVVVTASAVRSEMGLVVIKHGTTLMEENGVFVIDSMLRPTDVCDDGIAGKLGIPRPYLRKMRDEEVIDLLDHNINVWLDRDPDRRFLVRGFKPTDSAVGIARAFLSDSYRMIDHLDALVAALDGIRQAGAEVQVTAADLTERNMRLRIEAPAITALAPNALRNYRSPFGGGEGRDLPVLHAGLSVRNSETGGGAFVIAPYVVVRICSNGMTMTQDALRAVHLGAKLDEGIVWSEETKRTNVELITRMTTDAVSTFLDVAYVQKVADRLEAAAGVTLDKPQEVVEQVAKKHLFTQDERDGILSMFIAGGDVSPLGVMQAVTAFGQTVDDPDRAADFSEAAMPVLETALTLARR